MTHDELEFALRSALRGDPFWEQYLPGMLKGSKDAPSVHLAVFVEPYLGYVLDGTKTVESRFSANRVAPYECIRRGDIILLKSSGGPITGICRAAEVWTYHLQTRSWKEIRNQFARAMCAEEPEFWEERSRAAFATLIRIERVRTVPAIPFSKSDRRGWVVLSGPTDQLELAVVD